MLRWVVALSAIAVGLACCKAKADEPTALLPPELTAKVQEIKAACGSKIVSTYRTREKSRVAGSRTHRLSDHALHKAADLSGNPTCIKAHLKNWPGGQSTDYWSAPGGPHIHISYNRRGPEWGKKFVHYHPRKKTRIAAAQGTYASAATSER